MTVSNLIERMGKEHETEIAASGLAVRPRLSLREIAAELEAMVMSRLRVTATRTPPFGRC
jgi:hypothetical protein